MKKDSKPPLLWRGGWRRGIKIFYFYMMQEQEIKAILSKVKWDMPLSTDDLYRIFTGAESQIGCIDKK